MRKLFLASNKFKVGDNEFEQHNLVVVEPNDCGEWTEGEHATEIAKACFLKESEGTDREWIATSVTTTYSLEMANDDRKQEGTENDHGYTRALLILHQQMLARVWDRLVDQPIDAISVSVVEEIYAQAASSLNAEIDTNVKYKECIAIKPLG